MKLMIIGHARHGKDTACEILRDNHSFTFRSSSEAACELVIYPALKASHGYETIEECFNDRQNHRDLWHHLIWQHNRNDHTNLARAIYAEHDIYCGMRHITELKATRAAGLFDYAIWVDRSQHQPPKPPSSCTVTRNDADYVLDNNGTLKELEQNIDLMMGKLYSDMKRKQPQGVDCAIKGIVGRDSQGRWGICGYSKMGGRGCAAPITEQCEHKRIPLEPAA